MLRLPLWLLRRDLTAAPMGGEVPLLSRRLSHYAEEDAYSANGMSSG